MSTASTAKLCYRRIASATQSSVLPINGVIFDMDGTLTIPVLKFNELRRRLGISDNTDILQHAQHAPVNEKSNIYKIINAFEQEGTQNLKLQPHIYELFYYLKENKCKTALLTRNNRSAVDAFIKRFIEKDSKEIFIGESDVFSKVVTRDFIPVKPNPAAVHHICSFWNVPEETVVVVGDDLTDIQCGNRAGSVSVLLTKPSGNNDWKAEADLSITSLDKLTYLLKSSFEVTKK